MYSVYTIQYNIHNPEEYRLSFENKSQIAGIPPPRLYNWSSEYINKTVNARAQKKCLLV